MPTSIVPMQNQRSTTVTWGRARCELGDCLVAEHAGDLCWLDIAPDSTAVAELAEHFSACDLRRDDARAQTLLDAAMTALGNNAPLRLQVRGTEFQRQVWQALTEIGPGERLSYGQLAARIGRPGAARAVGSAAGANVIALFIPCHRLVPADGRAGAYRWGSALKQKLLAAEQQAA